MAILHLGSVDGGALPSDKQSFLAPYHRGLPQDLLRKNAFRDEGNHEWRSFEEVPGTDVHRLQEFLKESGFFPLSLVDGVFGYATTAATRLFQEYVRSVLGEAGIGTPDGKVGPNTWKYIEEWKRSGWTNEWGDSSSADPYPEYNKWMRILNKAKDHFQSSSEAEIQMVNNYPTECDTLKVKDWSFSPDDIHLLGLRRNPEQSAEKRENDDLFIFLIRGMVFKFWGSTDPSAKLAGRPDEAFLVEGQHKYRFGWHKVSQSHKVYRALRPYTKGVLVFRDFSGDNALGMDDIQKGLQPPNPTINIHWSGDGGFNFSAGCQVIAGRSYTNQCGDVIDCSAFSSSSYDGLAQGKTRGAYNVIADLATVYHAPTKDYALYTLGREKNLLAIAPEFSSGEVADMLKRMKR